MLDRSALYSADRSPLDDDEVVLELLDLPSLTSILRSFLASFNHHLSIHDECSHPLREILVPARSLVVDDCAVRFVSALDVG